jgi:heme/copper-type cytochrome/quinol oxidase subunit 2
MSRGRGQGSMLPLFAMIILAVTISLCVILFGASMQSEYIESNYTAGNTTLIPYEIHFGWWTAVTIIIIVIAFVFALWYFYWG